MRRPAFYFEQIQDPAAQEREIQAMHRRVFGTDEGKIVLTMLLEGLYYFDVTATPEQVALKNFATSYKDRLGNLDTFGEVDALLAAINKKEP